MGGVSETRSRDGRRPSSRDSTLPATGVVTPVSRGSTIGSSWSFTRDPAALAATLARQELDLARSAGDAPQEAAAVERARALLDPPDPETSFGARYLRVLQEHPAAVLAHRDVTAALAGLAG